MYQQTDHTNYIEEASEMDGLGTQNHTRLHTHGARETTSRWSAMLLASLPPTRHKFCGDWGKLTMRSRHLVCRRR